MSKQSPTTEAKQCRHWFLNTTGINSRVVKICAYCRLIKKEEPTPAPIKCPACKEIEKDGQCSNGCYNYCSDPEYHKGEPCDQSC